MSVLTACNYTEGQCWIDGEGAGSVGAGGGPLVPGWGGFGEVPPEPQGVGDPLPPDCNIVKDTPCKEKCLADYVAAAEKCTELKDNEAQKRTCDEAAFARYASCREECVKQENDCLEHCKQLCDQIMDKCKEDCKNDPNPSACRSRCMDDYGKCLKECDKKCK